MAVSANIFKNLGKSVAYSSLDVVTSLMPNTAEITRGLRSGVDATRDFIRTNQAKLQIADRQADRGTTVKRAKSFLADAWSDIKKGNLALGDLADESYDDFAAFKEEANSSQITYSDKEVQDQEAGQVVNTVSSSKLVSTDFRTIKGLRHMTETLGKTQIKVAEYQTERITQSIFNSMALNQSHFGIIEKQLDSINKNIGLLVKFQSDSQAATNKAHLVFYDQVTQWMKKQEKREIEKSRRTRSATRSKSQQFLGSQWFDAAAYKELVKENFENSTLGMAANMLSMVDPALMGMMMGGGFGGGKIQPQRFALNALMRAMLPRNAHRSFRRMDNQVNTMLKTMLSRAGSYWQTPGADKHPLMSLLGSIFGVDSSARRSLRLGEYKRGDMNWNGEAQRVLVSVIPKQLSEIKAAILKTGPEYYDSRTGKFQNVEQVRARTRRAFQNEVELPFANMFNRDEVTLNPDDAANKKYWQSLSDDVHKQISSIVNEAVRNEVGLTTEMTRKIDQMINDSIKDLGGTVADTQRIVTSLAEGVNQARSNTADFIKKLQEQDTAFSQVADMLANENGVVSFSKLMDFLQADSIDLGAANGGRYAWNGKRYDEMTPEERRRFDAQRQQISKTQQWVRNLSRSDNKWKRRAGRVINGVYDRYTGTGSRYAQGISRAVDRVSNELYRATMLGETPDFGRRGAASTSASMRDEGEAGGDTGGGDDSGPRPQRNNGGIVNQAWRESQNDARNSLALRQTNALEEMNETSRQTFGEKGYMRKFFDNPLLKKFWDWLKDSKLGKAAKGGLDKAGTYVKNLFTEGYTDEGGTYHKSVKEELSDTGKKVSKFVGKMLGVDIDTGEPDDSAPEAENVRGAVLRLTEHIESQSMIVAGDAAANDENAGASSKSDRKAKAKKTAANILKSLNAAVRKHVPKILAGGAIGAALGASTGGSLGLIGGLFLPGGPIGGAIAGMGLSILFQSETFKRIVFGDKDEQTGERDGGLISKNLRDSFKKNLPKIVKGAAAGVAVKLLAGNIGGPIGTLGAIPSMLLPGGIMGAALMGSAGALMLGNENFMKTLFGEKGEDGKRTGAALSGVYNKVTQAIKGGKDKAGKDRKGLAAKLFSGLKGAAAGAVTAGTISQLGLLGSMLTPGGLLGGALVGAAINISGVGEKFNQFLFGKKDADGKVMQNGLFNRMGKAFEMNVIDPAKNWVKYTGEQFAWWAKEKIEVPFRLAFGPILDSFTAVKDAAVETAKGGIKAIAENVGNTIVNILKPVGTLFKKAVLAPLGKVAGGLLRGTLFAAGSLVGSPFQALALLMSGKRRKGQRKFGEFLKGDREGNLQGYWNRRREAGENVNELGDRIMYTLGTLPGVGQFFRNNDMMADIAEQFEQTPAGQGMNHLDWLGAGADKKRYKRARKASRAEEKREARILKLRQQFAGEEHYNEALDYGLMAPEQLKARYKALRRLGIDISTPEELKQFTYHYDDWKNPKAAEERDAKKPENRTANAVEEIRDMLKGTQDLQREANDIARANLDVNTGGVLDTEDIDPGDLADEIDEDVADQVQERKAGFLAKAWGKVQTALGLKKKKEETHAAVTGNTSGGDFTVRDANGNAILALPPHVNEEEEANADEEDNGSGGSFFSSLAGGLVSKFLGGGILKAGLVAGLVAALSNAEVRTALGNLLGNVIQKLPSFVAGGIKGLGSAILQMLGLSNGEDGENDYGRSYVDPETGETKTVFNEQLATSTVGALANPKGAGKAISKIPVVGKPAAKVGSAVGKVGSKVGSYVSASWGLAKDITKKEVSSEGANLLTKAFTFIQKCLDKVATSKLGKWAAPAMNAVSGFLKNITKGLATAGDDIIKIIASKSPKLAAALTKAGATVAGGAATAGVLNVVLGAYGAISGAVNAASIFKIDSDMVDWKMRLISGVFEALMNATGTGAVVSIINEITTAAMGFDFIQQLALTIYHVMADDQEDIDIEQAVKDFEQEVKNYNEANNTELSVDAYNDMKNQGLLTRAWNGIKNFFTGNKSQDLSQYEVGNYQSSTGNGMGALGYGPGMQNDHRWANMKLGKFPNGRDSTMATAGCGPTALSNAANRLGLAATPGAVGRYAVRNGFISQGGANDGLFEEGALGMGLSTRKVRSEDDIRKSLRAGQPVIMAGKSSGYGSTPYTPAGHIVTATGLDGAGNVIIDDPMRGTGKYRLSDMKDKMTAGWSVARGYGLISGIFGNALSQVATNVGAKFLSDKTGISLEEAKSRLAGGATDDPTNPDTSYNAATGTVSVTGGTEPEQNWNYLTQNGYKPNAAAAIMGCWQHESANKARRVEGDYLKKFPGIDTVLASNKALNDYTTNVLFPAYANSNISINKSAYRGTDGNYYPGIGLAQWTGPRGYNLFNFARSRGLNWADQGTQLEFFNSEVVAGSRINKNTLNAKPTVDEATKYFLDYFEQHAGYSDKNPSQFNKRLASAKAYLNKYGAATGYGLLDAMFGDTMSSLASGVGTKILSNVLGISEEEAAQRYNGTSSTSADASGTSSGGTGSGLVFPSTGNAQEDQKRLVKQMDSIKGTLQYSLAGNKQDPDKGVASCASTVAWAYNKVLGFKPGGSKFASSTGQSTDPNFTTVYQNDGTPLDPSVLQPGDIVYQNWDTTKYNGTVQHTEMYAGNGQDLSHGGNPTPGPTYKDLNDYRIKHTMLVRRYTPFIDAGDDTQTGTLSKGGRSAANGKLVGNGFGMGAFNVARAGQYQHNDRLATGYGPGVEVSAFGGSTQGVESRLDVIINLLRSLVNKKPGAATTTNNLNVNYGSGDTKVTKPTVVVNQVQDRQLGERDAQNEYLRSQHRKLAMAIHS